MGAIMFLGQHMHRLDNKGRLTMPRKFRPHLGETMVITKGKYRNLSLYPIAKWEQIIRRLEEDPALFESEEVESIRYWLLPNADVVTPDRLGRILIPASLREYAGLEQDVVIVGLNSYIELWAPEAWQEHQENLEREWSKSGKWKRLGM